MIKPQLKLPRTRQCQLVNIHRSTTYYRARPVSDDDQALMQEIDEHHLDKPFLDSRRLTDVLNEQGNDVGRNRVIRLMRLMGIQAIYPKPQTTQRNPEHKVYPYLLRNMTITRPNQVWATDISYIPMGKGFSYLTVIMDWYSRKVLSWRLSNSMDSSFCIEALEEAIHYYGCPEIFNSDQGCQYTSNAFTQVLKDHQIRISMDGRGT
jgi:putative transposase